MYRSFDIVYMLFLALQNF